MPTPSLSSLLFTYLIFKLLKFPFFKFKIQKVDIVEEILKCPPTPKTNSHHSFIHPAYITHRAYFDTVSRSRPLSFYAYQSLAQLPPRSWWPAHNADLKIENVS